MAIRLMGWTLLCHELGWLGQIDHHVQYPDLCFRFLLASSGLHGFSD